MTNNVKSNLTILLLSLFIYSSCANKPKTDVITGATKKHEVEEKLILPMESDTYAIIGEIKDLKGFIVKYDNNLYRDGDKLSEEGIIYLKSIGIKKIVLVFV